MQPDLCIPNYCCHKAGSPGLLVEYGDIDVRCKGGVSVTRLKRCKQIDRGTLDVSQSSALESLVTVVFSTDIDAICLLKR